MSAFSNTSGGWIVFGIKQKGKRFEVQGVNNGEKTESDFLNILRNGQGALGKYYARVEYKGTIGLRDLASHMHHHNTAFLTAITTTSCKGHGPIVM